MRTKLLLTLASAAFIAVSAAAIAGAAPLIDLTTKVPSSAPIHVDLPGQPTHLSLPVCADGVDNDGDGKVDLADPGCASSLGASEGQPQGSGGPGKKHRRRHHRRGSGSGAGGGTSGGQWSEGLPGGGDLSSPSRGRSRHMSKRQQQRIEKRAIRDSNGAPTNSNPGLTVADFGPAPLGVPNFVIDQFQIPPFLLPIYQACGTQYGIPWEVLASINKIETAFGTNLNVSSAGAVGWMQFLPSTWKSWGVDANNDGDKDPYNPVDAICSAARYLRAAGGDRDLRRGIFAYNHADWYVDEVLLYARSYGKLPDDLLGSLTGLTEGAHFPVAARARYADDISEREAVRRAKGHRSAAGNVADVFASSPTRRGINIYSRPGAPVVAVNDGVIRKIGSNAKLGNYIVLQDAYGNSYTYAQLGKVSKVYPAPKEKQLGAKDFQLVKPTRDRKPNAPATAGLKRRPGQAPASESSPARQRSAAGKGAVNTEDLRQRLFALPQRPHNAERAGLSGQLDSMLGDHVPGYSTFKGYISDVFQFKPSQSELKPLRKGAKVVGGTILGRIGKSAAPHVHFSIRPAGRGAPRIDPKPILDGWKLLESTALYRAAGKNALAGGASVGQVLLMSKTSLERRVLADPRIETYACGRTDIQSGQVDRRVLATLEYLVARGYRLTITSLKCGHGFLTASGNVSEHSSGNAVDIAQVNGIPILGHQGKGSITESVIRDLLKLQGPMRPHQIISLMKLGPPTFALSDHADHIHVGFHPLYGSGKLGQEFARLLKPSQWTRLIGRIAEIPQPTVSRKPSKYSLPVGGRGKRASGAHQGE